MYDNQPKSPAGLPVLNKLKRAFKIWKLLPNATSTECPIMNTPPDLHFTLRSRRSGSMMFIGTFANARRRPAEDLTIAVSHLLNNPYFGGSSYERTLCTKRCE
jgi:hypothetical protein